MSKRTFLCWACRTTYRAPFPQSASRRCGECGGSLETVSHRIEIPRKGDHSSWDELRQFLRARDIEATQQAELARTRRIHELERRLRDLKSREENPGRNQTIHELEKELLRSGSPTPNIRE